jgi:hypothetical protein
MLLTRWAVLGREVHQGTLQFLLQTALSGGLAGRPVLASQVGLLFALRTWDALVLGTIVFGI